MYVFIIIFSRQFCLVDTAGQKAPTWQLGILSLYKKCPVLLKHPDCRGVPAVSGLLLYPFLLQGNRIQGLGHARQALHSLDCLQSFKGVLQGFGKRLLRDNTPLPHTYLLPTLARTCSLKPERGGARLWPCQTWQKKKKNSAIALSSPSR